MSSNKRKHKGKKKHGGGHHQPPSSDPTQLAAQLAEQADAIESCDDPAAIGPAWGAAHKLLLKAKADAHQSARVIMQRDLAGLRTIIAHLAGESAEDDSTGAPIHDQHAGQSDESPQADIPAETFKLAMRAFRKRLKLTRLDHESKLGVGPMTGGKKADFDAIMAPIEYPQSVWDILVEQGKLKAMGKGFYALKD